MTEKKIIIKPKTEKEEYLLEDKDYLLIKAIQDLTEALTKLRIEMRK